MEEKNNQNEEIIQNPKKGEDAETDNDTILNPEDELSDESSGENKEHKKEKASKSKKGKEDMTEEMEQEVAQLNDKYLRLYSEFDNYRKRSIKERIELSKSAASDLITTLLPVLDDFERALTAMERGVDLDKEDAHFDGINLIYNKLKSILSQQGLERMKALGEEFNTDYHEALTKIPAPKPELIGKVVDVVQNGYILNGKVIRYAQVVVGD
jgi:molecular chaperone GrpE